MLGIDSILHWELRHSGIFVRTNVLLYFIINTPCLMSQRLSSPRLF